MTQIPVSGKNPNPLRSNLRAMIADGAAFSLMIGVGETYVPAFALALGLGDLAVGFIATVPMLAGGVLQLCSPWAVRRLRSHRRWVVACACMQAVSLLLLVAIALLPKLPSWLVFLPATLYWAAGLGTGPAWNTWVEDLVPKPIRATFFALRVRISQACVFTGIVLGGILLRCTESSFQPLFAFALLFGTAALSRLVSAAMLAKQSDRGPLRSLPAARQVRGASRQLHSSAGTGFIVYLLSVHVAVFMAGPYFTPYMLRELRFSYTEYMLLLSLGFLGKVLALPWAGKLAKKFGAGRLLWIGGIGIIPISAFWLVSDSFRYLLCLQVGAGMVWACYELAMFLLFFEVIPREDRVRMLTLYNLGHAIAVVTGALLGATIIRQIGDGKEAYMAVFALSSVARLATIGLIPKIHARATTAATPTLSMRTIAVRPAAGSLDRPILPGIVEEPAGGG